MDAATAALFPDSMEESELGLIPKGWSWISVGEIASVIDCLHSKKPELLEEGFPYLQLDTISDSGVLRFENAGLISKEDYDKWTSRIEVQGGDCLITNVGRVGAVSQVPDHFKAAIGRNITALRPKDSKLHRSLLIVALLSDFMKKEIKRNTDSGTILEALNVKNIPKLIIPGPSNSVLLEFAKLCDPIQLQLHELHEMNVNLKKIRDSLLPRLISGELQIPEDMLAS
jgi:type I restriction enzyme S subunit